MAADNRKLIMCLKKPPAGRTEKDLALIYGYFHDMEALAGLREHALRSLCTVARFEYYDANQIIYYHGQGANCWYILLSGSVFIEGSMFLPRSSFGRRSSGSVTRTSECLALEASEMVVIDYPDAAVVNAMPSQTRAVVSASNIELLLNDGQTDRPLRRMNSDSIIEQMPEDRTPGGTNFLPYGGIDHHGNNSTNTKRFSRASDTSSAYSGSDLMHNSQEDNIVLDPDFSGLTESMVDSDDEDGDAESTESFTIRDAERDCLEKEPSERTAEDLKILLDFTRHLKAFSNMTEHTRRLLCEVMVFAIVPKEGTIVMKDGEELDSWSVILNGEVEVLRPGGVRERLQMGDSFGISPTMEKLHHQGVMRTIVNDCQFVCIAQSNYYEILHQGEENIKRHEEKGNVVMVTEHRDLDGNRKGHIVIRGTSERLMQHLVENHSTIDPSYVEDFLLTCRTFLDSPLELVMKLLEWFEKDELKTSVTMVVLLWVNNHFNDFETSPEMSNFLEHFECLLEKEKKMMGQLTLLNMACTQKARVRNITLTRATRDEILHFSILGGLERGHGIFVIKVQPQSKAAEEGLKRGDQILEVNGHKFIHMYYNKALEILRGTTHLSITVKSNLLDFKEMLRANEKNNTPRKVKREDGGHMPNAKQRLSVPDLDSTVPNFHEEHGDGKKAEKRGGSTGGFFGSNSRLRKALTRMNFMPKNLNGRDSASSINHSDESLYSKPSRKSSTSSSSSNTMGIGGGGLGTLSNHLSASNPDMSSLGLMVDDRNDNMPEHVVKVYKTDQSFKYLLIHKETTAKEVVMLALQEFGITDPSCNYSLREVTVEMEKFIKSKRLPDTLSNLPDRLNLNGRYYLKNNLSSEPVIPDDLIGQLLAESQISLLQLNAHEVARQLTLNDYCVFRDIEPTEYVDDLYGLESKFGCHQLLKFADLVNQEMFWVVTEICAESNLVKRTKLLKHYIKIAKHCKDSKNFNSLFAILSGLGHGSISRLKTTWDRLPTKYSKLFEDLQGLMDPSRNMAKYRNLINSEHVQPPYIPFYPVFKKDMTFIHLGNDSTVDGLINFEKLRMIANKIRVMCNICSTKYDSSSMLLSNTNSSFQSALVSGMTTLKRTKNRRGSALPNAKKMFEEAQMVRRVRSYLSNMPNVTDEEKLAELSLLCEPTLRKRDPSPSVTNSPILEDKRVTQPAGPRFGSMGSTDSSSPTGSVRSMKPQYSSENDSGHSSIVSGNTSPPSQRRPMPPVGSLYCPAGQAPQVRPPLPSYSTVMHNASLAAAPISSMSSYPSHPPFAPGRRPPLPDYQAATSMARRHQQMRSYSQEHKSYPPGPHHLPPHPPLPPHHHQHHHQQQHHQHHQHTGVTNNNSMMTNADGDFTPPADEVEEEQVSAV